MRLQLTRIETLDKKFGGLAAQLCAMLDAGEELEDLQSFIQDKTGEKLPLQTISNFKQNRWLKQKRRIQAAKESTEATLQLLGEHGVTDIATAKIFEQFQEALKRGEQLALPAAARELRQLAELQARQQELEFAEEKLDSIKAVVTKEVEKKTPPDLLETRRKIREIYGLPDDSDKFRERPLTSMDNLKLEIDAMYGMGEFSRCFVCGRTVGKQDAFCPGCGRPQMSALERSKLPGAPVPAPGEEGQTLTPTSAPSVSESGTGVSPRQDIDAPQARAEESERLQRQREALADGRVAPAGLGSTDVLTNSGEVK